MATIYRCDRCKKEQSRELQLLRTQNSGGPFAELCAKCLVDFRVWVEKGV